MTTPAAQIDRVVRLFEAATRVNLACPHRHGNTIVLDADAGNEVMVTTDLHGNRLHFEKLLRIANLGEQRGRHLIMQEVCHGGPTFPGTSACMSHQLVEDVAERKLTFPDRFHFLLSNHELAEVIGFPIAKQGRMLNLAFRFGLQTFYGDGAEQVHQAMCTFLRSCPVAIRIAKHTLVTHSLPEDIAQHGFDATLLDRPLEATDWKPQSDLFRLMWGRDFSAANARMFCDAVHADMLIHGHEHCPTGYSTPNPYQLIIDSCGEHGCYVILDLQATPTPAQVVQRIFFLADAKT